MAGHLGLDIVNWTWNGEPGDAMDTKSRKGDAVGNPKINIQQLKIRYPNGEKFNY